MRRRALSFGPWWPATALANVNSAFDDLAPVISPDNLTLYFHSMRDWAPVESRTTRERRNHLEVELRPRRIRDAELGGDPGDPQIGGPQLQSSHHCGRK